MTPRDDLPVEPPIDSASMTGQPQQPDSGSDASDAAEVDALLPIVYDDLRALARRYLGSERPGHTLQPTAVVHEAYARLARDDLARWRDREHFQAIAAIAMRRILIEHARAKKAIRRGGEEHRSRVTLAGIASDGVSTFDIIALDDALSRLERLDPRQYRIVELRFFGGLDERSIAEQLELSRSTVQTDWRMAKAWLVSELGSGHAGD